MEVKEVILLSAENTQENDSDNLKSINGPDIMPILHYQPQLPKPSKIGIVNIDELKYDPKYWLARDLKELSEAERQQKRISRLRLNVQETALQERLRVLKEQQMEITETAMDYIRPALNILKPLAGDCFIFFLALFREYNYIMAIYTDQYLLRFYHPYFCLFTYSGNWSESCDSNKAIIH
jgi:hypothetical protein